MGFPSFHGVPKLSVSSLASKPAVPIHSTGPSFKASKARSTAGLGSGTGAISTSVEGVQLDPVRLELDYDAAEAGQRSSCRLLRMRRAVSCVYQCPLLGSRQRGGPLIPSSSHDRHPAASRMSLSVRSGSVMRPPPGSDPPSYRADKPRPPAAAPRPSYEDRSPSPQRRPRRGRLKARCRACSL